MDPDCWCWRGWIDSSCKSLGVWLGDCFFWLEGPMERSPPSSGSWWSDFSVFKLCVKGLSLGRWLVAATRWGWRWRWSPKRSPGQWGWVPVLRDRVFFVFGKQPWLIASTKQYIIPLGLLIIVAKIHQIRWLNLYCCKRARGKMRRRSPSPLKSKVILSNH